MHSKLFDILFSSSFMYLLWPTNSCYLQVLTTAFIIFSAVSIFVLCAESMPQFWKVLPREGNHTSNYTTYAPDKALDHAPKSLNNKLVIAELVTNTFFSMIFILRLFSCPDFKIVIVEIGLWSRFFAILSSWIVLCSDYYSTGNILNAPLFLKVFIMLRSLRTFRVVRVLQLVRGWDLIVLTVKSTIWELGILVALFLSGMLIFSTAIYYAEYSNPHSYPNIPSGFWWAIVTMTTVGYGDMYPTTPCGYLVGAVCAVMGLFAASLPIPIISANFSQIRDDWLMVNDSCLPSNNRRKSYELSIEVLAELGFDIRKQNKSETFTIWISYLA